MKSPLFKLFYSAERVDRTHLPATEGWHNQSFNMHIRDAKTLPLQYKTALCPKHWMAWVWTAAANRNAIMGSHKSPGTLPDASNVETEMTSLVSLIVQCPWMTKDPKGNSGKAVMYHIWVTTSRISFCWPVWLVTSRLNTNDLLPCKRWSRRDRGCPQYCLASTSGGYGDCVSGTFNEIAKPVQVLWKPKALVDPHSFTTIIAFSLPYYCF